MAARRITARDVADRAGVSQSTVSYVLNDTANQSIPLATKERVRQAARELGYTPSAAARTLRRGSSESVLLVLPDAPIGEMILKAIEGVAEVLEPHGFTVVYRRQKDGRGLASLWHELMPAAIAHFAAFPSADETLIEAAGIPVIGTSLDTDGAGGISVPQAAIGRVQAKHLIDLGHRTIAFASSTDPKVGEYLSRRLDGVRKECADAGLVEPVVVEMPFDTAGAVHALQGLLARPEPVTAICAYNDEIGFVVLAAMRELGLTAPEPLAVIGVDNIPLSRFAMPPLTTVDFHSDLHGRDIGYLVLQRLKPELALSAPLPSMAIDLVRRATT